MDLSILIHTFNGYKHLWPGCLESWRNTWVWDDLIPMYWGTDISTDEYLTPFTPLYSGPGEWSDRLRRLLEQIPTEYVLYCQEDHYPTEKAHWLAGKLGIMKNNDLLRLQLSPIVRFYTLEGDSLPLYFDPSSKYLVSHQPSIWKKSFLLKCLQPGETPWVNEYKGTLRLQQTGASREYISKKIAIYPCDWFSHKCIKGKVQS